MKYFVLPLIIILLLASIVTSAQTEKPNAKCKGVGERAKTLINQYKDLREKRRALPPGTFDRDVSANGGKLSLVLSALGRELGRPPYTKQIILACLGEPDAIRSHEQMRNFLEIYYRELRKAGRKVKERSRREYLIYFWRGWHDFLFFISEDGHVVDHGWWFAYE